MIRFDDEYGDEIWINPITVVSVHGASAFAGAFTQINMINNDFVFVKGSPKEVVAKLTDKSSSKQEREASGTALGDDC